MKFSLLFSFLFLLLASTLTAQEEMAVETELTPKVERPMIDKSLYPEVKDLGVTANLNGVVSNITALNRRDLLGASTMLIRYKSGELVTWRVGLAPNIYSNQTLSTDSVGKDLVEFDSSASQSNFSIRPGAEFHLRGTKRLDPYIALDAELGLVGKLKIGSVTKTSDTTGTSRVVRTITQDGGYVIGGKLSLGMNYYISPKLFVGLEYGMGVNTIFQGGDRQEVLQIEPVSGSNSTFRNISSARTRTLNFAVDPMMQVTFGYFFSL